MGSKNRVYLGMVTLLILHHIRNKYKKPIYMSKRVWQKIQIKHSDMLEYASRENFVVLLDNTVAVVEYDDTTDNFIANINGTYILYSLKSEKHHTSCNTIFKLKPSTLKKYYADRTFKVLKNGYDKILEEYIN